MEVHDYDLHNYLNRPDTHTKEERESLDCDLYDKSACCNAPLNGDLCRECLEHTDSACEGCDIINYCINENRQTT